MSNDARTSKIAVKPGEPPKDAVLVDVIQAKEPWSEYTLSDGSIIKLQLLCPLPVSVEIGDSFAAVFNADLDELAVEETEGDALDELKGSVAESYYLLKNERANLGPLQQRHWNFLQRIIREV